MKGQNAQTRAFCFDGISDHCNFDSPLLLILKRKVFTSSFFWYVPSPWSWSRKSEGHSKQWIQTFPKLEWCFSKDISKFVKRQLQYDIRFFTWDGKKLIVKQPLNPCAKICKLNLVLKVQTINPFLSRWTKVSSKVKEQESGKDTLRINTWLLKWILHQTFPFPFLS